MSLPNYHTIVLKGSSPDDVLPVLEQDVNLKRPVVVDLKSVDFDGQREAIGLIENHFSSNNISYKFPYPIFIVTDHESSISGMCLIQNMNLLPAFFSQKDGRMNVKESQLLNKNKLLQQEIKNVDTQQVIEEMNSFTRAHRKIYHQETQRLFYKYILNKLPAVKKDG